MQMVVICSANSRNFSAGRFALTRRPTCSIATTTYLAAKFRADSQRCRLKASWSSITSVVRPRRGRSVRDGCQNASNSVEIAESVSRERRWQSRRSQVSSGLGSVVRWRSDCVTASPGP
eukprot:1352658-Pleurochrysis_carterae.AAC.3